MNERVAWVEGVEPTVVKVGGVSTVHWDYDGTAQKAVREYYRRFKRYPNRVSFREPATSPSLTVVGEGLMDKVTLVVLQDERMQPNTLAVYEEGE